MALTSGTVGTTALTLLHLCSFVLRFSDYTCARVYVCGRGVQKQLDY